MRRRPGRAFSDLLDDDHFIEVAARDLQVAFTVAASHDAEQLSVLLIEKGFLNNIRNSFVVAGTVTVISVFVSSFAAYSLARFQYRFKGLVGRLILFAYLTPTSLLFIPLS